MYAATHGSRSIIVKREQRVTHESCSTQEASTQASNGDRVGAVTVPAWCPCRTLEPRYVRRFTPNAPIRYRRGRTRIHVKMSTQHICSWTGYCQTQMLGWGCFSPPVAWAPLASLHMCIFRTRASPPPRPARWSHPGRAQARCGRPGRAARCAATPCTRWWRREPHLLRHALQQDVDVRGPSMRPPAPMPTGPSPLACFIRASCLASAAWHSDGSTPSESPCTARTTVSACSLVMRARLGWCERRKASRRCDAVPQAARRQATPPGEAPTASAAAAAFAALAWPVAASPGLSWLLP